MSRLSAFQCLVLNGLFNVGWSSDCKKNTLFPNLTATLNSLRGAFDVIPSLSVSSSSLNPLFISLLLFLICIYFPAAIFWTSKPSNTFLSFGYKSLFFFLGYFFFQAPPSFHFPTWLHEPNTCRAQWKAALDMGSLETAAFKFSFIPSSFFVGHKWHRQMLALINLIIRWATHRPGFGLHCLQPSSLSHVSVQANTTNPTKRSKNIGPWSEHSHFFEQLSELYQLFYQ